MSIAFALGAVALGLWLSLLISRRLFRRHWHEPPHLRLADLPAVLAIVPAPAGKDAIPCLRAALRNLLAQEYPGPLKILVVARRDRADLARIEAELGTTTATNPTTGLDRAALLAASPPRTRCSEGIWALRHAFKALPRLAPETRYLFLADPGLAFDEDLIARLAARAEVRRLDLYSLLLRRQGGPALCRAFAAAVLFLFRLRFPPGAINDPISRHAAAGDAILVRVASLRKLGRLEVSASSIDAHALARMLKARGAAIRLDLSSGDGEGQAAPFAASWRRAGAASFAEIGATRRGLAGEAAGIALAFLLPPALAIFAPGWTAAVGLAGWIAMSLAFLPALRYFRVSPLCAPLLPCLVLLHLASLADAARASGTLPRRARANPFAARRP